MWGRNLTVSNFGFLPFKCFSFTNLMASVTSLTAFYVLDPGTFLLYSKGYFIFGQCIYALDIQAVNSRETLSGSSS